MKVLANSIARWMPKHYCVLGTDGYGLSDSRAHLRQYFEISCDHICHTAIGALYRKGEINTDEFESLVANLNVDLIRTEPN